MRDATALPVATDAELPSNADVTLLALGDAPGGRCRRCAADTSAHRTARAPSGPARPARMELSTPPSTTARSSRCGCDQRRSTSLDAPRAPAAPHAPYAVLRTAATAAATTASCGHRLVVHKGQPVPDRGARGAARAADRRAVRGEGLIGGAHARHGHGHGRDEPDTRVRSVPHPRWPPPATVTPRLYGTRAAARAARRRHGDLVRRPGAPQ